MYKVRLNALDIFQERKVSQVPSSGAGAGVSMHDRMIFPSQAPRPQSHSNKPQNGRAAKPSNGSKRPLSGDTGNTKQANGAASSTQKGQSAQGHRKGKRVAKGGRTKKTTRNAFQTNQQVAPLASQDQVTVANITHLS